MIPAIDSEQGHPPHLAAQMGGLGALGRGVFRTMPLRSISPFHHGVSTPIGGGSSTARGSFGGSSTDNSNQIGVSRLIRSNP
jgi:hypothetical protein